MLSKKPTTDTQSGGSRSVLETHFVGKIRDPLHDTIPFTCVEKHIIDSPEFQRLRRIRQTAFIHYVFPGATHSRFEHSLGVMHISSLIFTSIAVNQRRILTDLESALVNAPPKIKQDFYDTELQNGSLMQTSTALSHMEKDAYLQQCVRFAALLHDCGHAAFSHSGERFMPTWGELETGLETLNIASWLKEALLRKIRARQKENPRFHGMNVRHEIYTLFLIERLFRQSDEMLSPKMAQDVCALIDLAIPPSPGGTLEKSGLQNLFHEIISGEIDADRMDYLLRDSRECGVVYGYFDLGRILDSVSFYFNPKAQKYHLAIRRSGVAAFEDYLRARWSMYQQVYFHKTATACEAMLAQIKKLIPNYTFPLNLDDYLKIDDSCFAQQLQEHLAQHPQKNYLEKNLSGLLFERKLWKRVYEESVPRSIATNYPSLCPAVMKYLKMKGIPAELVETSTNLTRFSPKGRESGSQNNLRIILKNVHMLRHLDHVENHSTLINRVDEEILIKRIFVSRFQENGEEINMDSIYQMISENIINPNQHT